MSGGPLRVVVLTADASGNAARLTDHLLRAVDSVEVVGALVDLGTAADRRRQVRRLKAWVRHGGVSYAAWRLWLTLEARVRPLPPPARYARSLADLGAEHGFPVLEAPSVNSDEAAAALRSLDADLGVSLGNRVIQPRIFSIPRQGMVNLHHGRIPDYRGGPPAFWELHDGAGSMGVSVHRIDEHLDHGELLARDEVPVQPGDTPRTLMQRAYTIDYRVLARALEGLAAGTAAPLPVDFSGSVVKTLPDRAALARLRARIDAGARADDYLRAPLEPTPS